MVVPNEKLRTARLQRHWSQERAAANIGIDRKTYVRWEQGQHTPQPGTLEMACKAFGMTAEELGFDTGILQERSIVEVSSSREVAVFPASDSFEEEARDWSTWLGIKLAQIITMVSTWRDHAIFCDEIQIMVDQEIKMIDHELQQYQAMEQQAISRRQALTTIAALPTALVLGAGLVTDAAIEEFLPRCAASITSCWHLMKGKGFVAVDGILSTFAPSLAALALRPSKYQQAAARLSVQSSIIQGILAMHRLNFTKRELHCQEAVRYATISQDRTLQAASLMYLGYTYSHCYYPRQPQRAVPLFKKALYTLGEETTLLRSDILMGLAEAHAQCKEEQEALSCIGQAQDLFPADPELDPSFIYADCGVNTLYQWQGKTYLQLVEHFPDAGYQQKAAGSLMQSIGISSISDRSTNETLIYQADAARVLGELKIYSSSLRQAAQMASAIGSRRRYNDALLVYQRTPEKWRKERQIQALAKDVFKQLPMKKG
jgi:transcriptional regulator with XRE-family HTH domain/tetratricopeptide (TPR) repeat protein